MAGAKRQQERECVECGATFVLVWPSNRKKTCSPECALQRHRRQQREHQKAHYVPRVNSLSAVDCPSCGRSFQPTRSFQKYCSTLCNRQAIEVNRDRKKAPRVCMKCGAPVEMKPGYPVCDDCKVDPRPNAQARERRRTLRTYGLTVEDFDRRLADQHGRCAICGTDEPGTKGWCVDHDHESGAVRGLLCSPCNLAIGYMGDDPERLKAAATYLLGTRPKTRRGRPAAGSRRAGS
jgi:Recombination endonuclease VII